MTMIETIADEASFEKLKEEWNELLQASSSNCVFLTWEWLHTWWKHLSKGRRLNIIAVRCGRELTAIAPLVVRPHRLSGLFPFRSFEFLGAGGGGADYLDLIIRRGKERLALQALAKHLADENLMLELTHVNRNSCYAAELAVQLSRRGWIFSDIQVSVCPFINLFGHSWQSYLATLGPRHRYNFQRRFKNLTKGTEVRFEQALSEEQRRKALAILVSLHEMRWQEREESDAFNTPSLCSFHEELSQLALQRGWLRLFVLWVDGRPAASLYGFRYHRRFYFFQSGFDPSYGKHSVGLVTMGLAIKSAIEEGAEEYDLLNGDEEYKFHWAAEARQLGRLEVYPATTCSLLYKRAVGLNRAIRRMARQVLPKIIIDPRTSRREIGDWREVYAEKPD